MISKEADRGRRGDRARRMAANAARLGVAFLLGSLLWAAPSGGSAQEGQPQPATRSDVQMQQALRALARGLAERAKELDQEGAEALATGSITAPFPRSWIAPVPLSRLARLEPSIAPTGRDVGRLFDPDPLGAPASLARIPPQVREQAAAVQPPPAVPAARPDAAPKPLPEPRIDVPPPAPLTLPQATAALPPPAPVMPLPPPRIEAPAPPASLTPAKAAEPPAPPAPTPPARTAARPADDPQPARPEARPADREEPARRSAARPAEEAKPRAKPAEDEPKAKSAGRGKSAARIATRPADNAESQSASEEAELARKAPARRTAARPAAGPEPETEPDSEGPAAKPARRAKPERLHAAERRKPAARVTAARGAPDLLSPDVTGSTPQLPPRLPPRALAARPLHNARSASDIPLIPLPEALRPTRPPAGSPL